jgi:hypothetical protein
MRSYYSHLEATKSIGENVSLAQRPVFRSSAIFPVLHNSRYSSRILFMGYWLVKRNITEIGLLYTLRKKNGSILSRKYSLIDSAKAFSIDMSEFSEEIKQSGDINDFTGSLELEIFSTKDLVFPYPAFVLVYYSDSFSTVVHTVGRIYNDTEDMLANTEYKVRESGFDIYGDENLEPFVAFTNGALKNNNPQVEYRIHNADGAEFSGIFSIPPLAPFETVYLHLKEHIDLASMLSGRSGTIKLGHNFEGFFPRFLVGNFDHTIHSVSITHSYYDSSEVKDERSYWNRKDDNFNDSSVAIPLYLEGGYYTELAIYPIFSPSDFTLSFDFYNEEGKPAGSLQHYKPVKSSDDKYELINFNSIVQENNLDASGIKSVNILCNWEDKQRIPTRIKFGLNVGASGNGARLPSNICFAPLLGNPNILKKTHTFRWAPLLNIGRSEIVFTNSSPLKNYNRPANIELQFYREKDTATLKRQLNLDANGILTISSHEDEELNQFLDGRSGWVTANADNPFVNGWYFDFHPNGSVAADHVF